jgi:hypothetical protein
MKIIFHQKMIENQEVTGPKRNVLMKLQILFQRLNLVPTLSRPTMLRGEEDGSKKFVLI